MKKPEILIVDDDKSVLTSLLILFRHHGYDPIIENNPQEIRNVLAKHDISLIILDMNFRRGFNEGKEGLYWLEMIQKINPSTKVLLITAYGEIHLAIDAMKKGASDLILKPWQNDHLMQKVASILEESKQPEIKISKELYGSGPEIKRIQGLIDKSASLQISTLIKGDIGTGRKHIGQMILEKSGRSSTKTINFQKGDPLPQPLPKYALFHQIELASIEDQNTLANHMENHDDLQWIGTVSDISELNRDLYNRLNLMEIQTRPLNEIIDIIPSLATSLTMELAHKYKRNITSVSEAVIDRLMKNYWTENIKELKHVLERAVILSEKEELSIDDIQLQNEQSIPHNPLIGNSLNLNDLEKEAIVLAIQESNGNITNAAKKLGITRTALYRRMEKYDI